MIAQSTGSKQVNIDQITMYEEQKSAELSFTILTWFVRKCENICITLYEKGRVGLYTV